jgi:hypothetical protein
MIGVALLGLVTILAGSTRRGMVSEYDRYLADIEAFSGNGLDDGAVQRLRARPEVAAVVPQWCTDTGDAVSVGSADGGQAVCAMDPAGLGQSSRRRGR